MITLHVTLPPSDTVHIIEDYVTRSGFTSEKSGKHHSRSQDGKEAIMLVFEKYFVRNSSRASLSVMIDNLMGGTTVYAVGSGGGQMTFFKFDWGASDNLEYLVEKALKGYIS